MSAVLWSMLAGDTSKFALELSLLSDDVDDRMVDADERASWGSFRLWVKGRNICVHEEQGETLTGAHWYLLPVLEWFTYNWDAIFHEERLPFPSLTDVGAHAALEAYRRSFGTDDTPDWEALERVQSWRSRHSIRNAAEGGLFPDLWLRRHRESLEVSVGAVRDPGTPGHFRFAADGRWLIDVREAATAVYEVIEAASARLSRDLPQSARILALRAAVASVQDGRGRYPSRFAWLSGAGGDLQSFKTLWDEVEAALGSEDAESPSQLLGSGEDGQLVLTNAPVALLFGSLAPTLEPSDVRVLSALAAAKRPLPSELAKVVLLTPDDRATLTPGELGSELGESAYEVLVRGRFDKEGYVDIAQVLASYSVDCSEINLSDRLLRGVSILLADGSVKIASNRNFYRGVGDPVRRFTLAHELAHVMIDRESASSLAVTSGPWAPKSLEQRANAFAAALLMPGPLLAEQVAAVDGPLSDFKVATAVAANLRVSVASLADRLYNLGEISREDADDLRGYAEFFKRGATTRGSGPLLD